MTTNIQEKELKLHYLEYVYETEEGKVRNIIAAYTLQQADQIYAIEILAKDDVEERDAMRYLISDERVLEMGLNAYTKPGVIS
jgi:hypothetical protein